MLSVKRQLGNLGEKAAADFLRNLGYEILDTNFQNRFGRQIGEIDIVARDKQKNELVFAEVKTRELEKYQDTLPEENITYPKLRKLERIANVYMRLKKLENSDFRFDAISVWLDNDSKMAKIKHIPHL